MKKAHGSVSPPDDWEPPRRPRCVSCGGETVSVLVSYGDSCQDESECLLCGKSFKAGDIKKFRNKRPRRKPHRNYRRH